MVSLTSLWLPILLSAAIVFVASSIIHMLLHYHSSDFRKVPQEDQVMDALRKIGVPPGDYIMPYCADAKSMKSPEFIEKMSKGPVALMTVMPSGPPAMGKNLVAWFIYCVVVAIFAAYLAGRALGPGAPYLAVFRFAGCTAFIGYTLAAWQSTIWYHRSLSAMLKLTIDGLIYGLLTAGTFGWLWPS